VSAPSGVEFEAKITPIVIISCIMAATGGLMFGYDVGISGTPGELLDLIHLLAHVSPVLALENHAKFVLDDRYALFVASALRRRVSFQWIIGYGNPWSFAGSFVFL
jgi:hypothetical protein